MWLRFALTLAALAAAGCSLGEGEKTACMVDGDCRTGRVCRGGRCQAPVEPGDGSPDVAVPADATSDAGAESMVTPGGCPEDEFRSGDRCVSDVVSVAAAENRTCAVTKLGQVWCWGGSSFAVVPERVPAIEDAREVSVGGSWGVYDGFACAVTRGERVLCWGDEYLGQLGDGVMGISKRSTPAPVITAGGQPLEGVRSIALGDNFGCATTADKLHCWGENTYGQLGAPVALGNGVIGYPTASPPQYYRPYAAPVEGVPGTAAGVGFAVVMASDGQNTVCGWGGNGSGHRYWPVLQMANENPVPGCRPHTEVVELAGGFDGACLRQRSGDIACWGSGLGVDDLPGQRAALPAAMDLTAGAEHACAALADGRAFCWGRLRRGELGNGARASGSETPLGPQPVTALGSDVVGIGSGVTANHTCAIKRDGSLHCWGRNDAGQMGNANAPNPAPTPFPVEWL